MTDVVQHEVTSFGQSGGITAAAVTVSGDLSVHAPSKPRGRKSHRALLALLTALASIATILTYLEARSAESSMKDNTPVINVTSYAQQGGITAGQVNIAPQARHLHEQNKSQLRTMLPREKKVTVVSVWGDGEAFGFAHEIKEFLAQDGYEVSGVDQAMYNAPVRGQSVQPRNDGFEVVIGTRE